MDSLPAKTMRDLGILLVVVGELAWEGTKTALRRYRHLVEPPADIQVRSTRGEEYTGLLIIDGNTVVAGIVVRTGRSSPGPSAPGRAPTRGLLTPSPRDIYPPRETRNEEYLPSWADTGDEDEEDAWYPRTQR